MNLTELGRWIMKAFRSPIECDDESCAMTLEEALSYPPVWHCVSKITGAFAIMPLNLHRERGREKSIQSTHPVYSLMRWRPNAYQTPSVFKRQMMMHALMFGNARAYIRRENGIPVELIPLLPDRSDTQLVNGEKWHATVVEKDDRVAMWERVASEESNKVMYFNDSQVFHIPGLGFDGVKGYGLIEIARLTWKTGAGESRITASQQQRGYAGGLVVEVPPGQLRNQKDAEEFHRQLSEKHAGTDNAGKILMLREGVTAKVLAMSNADAQFLEQRRFNRENTALQFLLEGILGDSSNASYSSLEQKNLAYRQNCLAPWTTTWEEESEIKLLTESERRRGYYMKFNDGALLRTEKAATMSFISQGIASRVLNPNEGREMLDMNPYDGGDQYANPAIDTQRTGGADNQPSPQNMETRAVEAMLSNLIKVEADRVKNAASKPAEFVAKIDRFYADWSRKLADNIEKIGGDRGLADKYCEQSKAMLLDASECQPDELRESIARCVHSWGNRVYQLVEEMCGTC